MYMAERGLKSFFLNLPASEMPLPTSCDVVVVVIVSRVTRCPTS